MGVDVVERPRTAVIRGTARPLHGSVESARTGWVPSSPSVPTRSRALLGRSRRTLSIGPHVAVLATSTDRASAPTPSSAPHAITTFALASLEMAAPRSPAGAHCTGRTFGLPADSGLPADCVEQRAERTGNREPGASIRQRTGIGGRRLFICRRNRGTTHSSNSQPATLREECAGRRSSGWAVRHDRPAHRRPAEHRTRTRRRGRAATAGHRAGSADRLSARPASSTSTT